MTNRPAGQGRDNGNGHGDSGRRPILRNGAFREVDVDILFVIEIRINSKQGRPAADTGNGSFSGFLHDISQVSGQIQFAGTVHHGDFHVEHFAADGRPCQAPHQADGILPSLFVCLESDRTKEFCQIIRSDSQRVKLLFRNAACSLPADRCQFTLQHTHPGLPRISGNQTADRRILHFELGSGKAVLFALFRKQMPFGNLQLLFIGIARKFDHFHPVEQCPRDCGGIVGCRDKKDMREIKRDLQEMIPECGILFRIEHFEQGSCWIAPVIGTELVNFIQNDKRIARPRLRNGVDNPARHRPDIGLPVPADIRFVMHTAERNTHELTVGSFGNAHGNACFTCSRCTGKAEQAAFDLRRALFDGKIFQNAFLHLDKAIVILIQDPAGLLDIYGLFCIDAPGQFKTGVQIGTDHCSLRGSERLLRQVGQLFAQLFLDFV